MSIRRRALVVLVAALAALAAGMTTAEAKPGKGKPWVTSTTTAYTIPISSTTTTAAGGGGSPAPTTTTTTTIATAPPATTTTTTTTAPPPPSETRQAALWPFAATSPWNLGVGSGAQFESAASSRTASLIDTAVTPWVNAGQYSHPIVRAASTDPLASVSRSGYPTEYYRIPNSAVPANGSDKHLHVVEPDGRWLHESWYTQGANPAWTTGYHVKTDLWGPGVGEKGVRAYGGSAVGGLVRAWELEAGSIRHAIALAITGSQLKTGWVWPATTQDGNAASTYTGQVPMGTFAAIPPSVDVTTLGLTRDGLVLARALQDYGAYVVDRAGVFVAFTDPSLEGTPAVANLRADLGKLRAQLRVVTNNGPSSVNGGGAPRVAPAPPFAS